MKRKPKKSNKNILIKRVYLDKGNYDYVPVKEVDYYNLLTQTRGRTSGHKYEKAEWNEVLKYKIKNILKNRHSEKIVYMIVGMLIALLGKYVYDVWIN
ncbi:hypothetical protein [uncultured Winogradskyella sp.]|uniref:hypothetical protein n=1 Tax=uncultured Winogradskyella sp. TaxID=395353 RepID=UPI002607D4B1|nr:hypothetical protein [uncultured Winogradskyella sp.]